MAQSIETKNWYTSKTLWLNIIAIIAIASQSVAGKEVVDPNAQTALLAIINMIVRLITNKPIS